MNVDLLKWWLNYLPLTDEENTLVRTERTDNKIYEGDYKTLENEFFKNLDNSNISSETHCVRIAESASILIKQLFENEVDDDTLIISSTGEHETVRNILSQYKNVLILNHKFHFNFNKKDLYTLINQNIGNCKKVFIYIIGTHISTGLITPQNLFRNIMEILTENNIPYKMTIDDVHGLFVSPRDYSIFDYVIGTAHALIRPYDMGLIISRNEKYGEKIYNWFNDYMIRLRIILKRMTKMRLFSYVLSQTFSEYLSSIDNNITRYADNAPNIFALDCKQFIYNQRIYDKLDNYEIRMEKDIDDIQHVIFRLRAAQFITFPELLIDGVKLLDNYIESCQSISTMSLL